MSKFDIILVSYNRAQTLEKLFDSFPRPLPSELNSIIILTHRDDESTQSLLNKLSSDFPINNVKIDNRYNPGKSRNILIDKSCAEYLCFLDDDAQCCDDYFNKSLEKIKKGIDILGGPDQSVETSVEQKIMGEILQSKFVMGPTYKRHSRETQHEDNAKESQLTLCNMWVKREVFTDNKLKFNEDLRRCEENQLLEELKSLGYSFSYDPDIFVYHLRREKLSDISRIQFLSGFYRSVCFYLNRENFKIFFILPILTGFILSFFYLIPLEITLGLSLLHIILSVIILFKSRVASQSIQNFFWGWLVIIIIHIFFSLGSFWGLILGWKKIERDQT